MWKPQQIEGEALQKLYTGKSLEKTWESTAAATNAKNQVELNAAEDNKYMRNAIQAETLLKMIPDNPAAYSQFQEIYKNNKNMQNNPILKWAYENGNNPDQPNFRESMTRYIEAAKGMGERLGEMQFIVSGKKQEKAADYEREISGKAIEASSRANVAQIKIGRAHV